jgi:excisionase family DNA binding protein
METDICSVEQAASILGLHPKTVRGFIQSGKLKARKLGKSWRIRRDDIEELLGHESGRSDRDSDELPPSPTHVSPAPSKVQITTIIDISVSNRDEGDRLSTAIIASVNAKDQELGNARIDYIFYDTEKKARFIVFGGAEFMSQLLALIARIS